MGEQHRTAAVRPIDRRNSVKKSAELGAAKNPAVRASGGAPRLFDEMLRKEGRAQRTWESSPIREPKDDARAATPWRAAAAPAAGRHHHLPATQATRAPATDAAGSLAGPWGAQTSSIKPSAARHSAPAAGMGRGQEEPELRAAGATSSPRRRGARAAASLARRMSSRRAPRWHPRAETRDQN